MPKPSLALAPKEELYIALLDDDIDLSWTQKDKRTVEKMWEAGADIDEMSKALRNRDTDEILILLIDLARQEKLSQRDGGIFRRR